MSRDSGRFIKTTRSDKYDFTDKFVRELLAPDVLENRFEKREEGQRLPFTLRLNLRTHQYEIVSTQFTMKAGQKKRQSPSLYQRPQKLSVTKHQSVSYVNPKEGYKPPYFGHDRKRRELLVGYSFDPKDCLLWFIKMYDNGTRFRPNDFRTEQEARSYLEKSLQEQVIHTSLESLEAFGKTKPENYNEVLAGLKWNCDGSSHVTVFSNNLESRLLAQVRAFDLQKRLEEKYRSPIVVPISIYPDFELYTPEMQAADICAAKKDNSLAHYLFAIDFIRGANKGETLNAIIVMLSGPKGSQKNFFELLKRTNAKAYDYCLSIVSDYIKKNIMDAFKISPVALACFIDTIESSETIALQKISRDHLQLLTEENWYAAFDECVRLKKEDDFTALLDLAEKSFVLSEIIGKFLLKREGDFFKSFVEKEYSVLDDTFFYKLSKIASAAAQHGEQANTLIQAIASLLSENTFSRFYADPMSILNNSACNTSITLIRSLFTLGSYSTANTAKIRSWLLQKINDYKTSLYDQCIIKIEDNGKSFLAFLKSDAALSSEDQHRLEDIKRKISAEMAYGFQLIKMGKFIGPEDWACCDHSVQGVIFSDDQNLHILNGKTAKKVVETEENQSIILRLQLSKNNIYQTAWRATAEETVLITQLMSKPRYQIISFSGLQDSLSAYLTLACENTPEASMLRLMLLRNLEHYLLEHRASSAQSTKIFLETCFTADTINLWIKFFILVVQQNESTCNTLFHLFAQSDNAPTHLLFIEFLLELAKILSGLPPLTYPPGHDHSTIAQRVAYSFRNDAITYLLSSAYRKSQTQPELYFTSEKIQEIAALSCAYAVYELTYSDDLLKYPQQHQEFLKAVQAVPIDSLERLKLSLIIKLRVFYEHKKAALKDAQSCFSNTARAAVGVEKIFRANKLIDAFIKCNNTDEIVEKIMQEKPKALEINKKKFFTVGKSNYEKLLEACLSDVQNYRNTSLLQIRR